MKQPGTLGRRTDSQSGDGQAQFSDTHWSKLMAVRAGVSNERRSVLNFLIQRYWKPVYCYARRCGHGEEDAKDLVQEFFAACLRNDFFAKADPVRGRFRNFLLSSLKHFLANAHRAAQAGKRRPVNGFVPIHDLASDDSRGFQPVDRETPDAVFHRAWVADLTQRVLRSFERECQTTGKGAHYELFRQRIVLPALEGTEPPPLQDLARPLGLSEKQAANALLTARRAYQRLLQEEIRGFAGSGDEADAEIRDLLQFLGNS